MNNDLLNSLTYTCDTTTMFLQSVSVDVTPQPLPAVKRTRKPRAVKPKAEKPAPKPRATKVKKTEEASPAFEAAAKALADYVAKPLTRKADWVDEQKSDGKTPLGYVLKIAPSSGMMRLFGIESERMNGEGEIQYSLCFLKVVDDHFQLNMEELPQLNWEGDVNSLGRVFCGIIPNGRVEPTDAQLRKLADRKGGIAVPGFKTMVRRRRW